MPLVLAGLALLSGTRLAAREEQARVPVLPADSLPLELPDVVPLGLAPDTLERHGIRPAVRDLGRALFFDPVLSEDGDVSCASCHDPARGFASPDPIAVGRGGQLGDFHAPTLLNRAAGEQFLWDGRAASLEEQVLMPLSDPREMGTDLGLILERLGSSPEWSRRFEEAFGGAPDAGRLADALASFVRSLLEGDSPVDRFQAGDASALDEAEQAGLWIFESSGRCWRCHNGPNFTDESFHNTGVGVVDGTPPPGRAAVTGEPAHRGAFKTPTLRGLAHTAPYMHDGSQATLAEVVEFYRRGGESSGDLDPLMQPLELSDRDAANLVAFLEALTHRP